MYITDGLHYIAIGNPISKAIISGTSSLVSRAKPSVPVQADMTKHVVKTVLPSLHQLAGRHYYFMRLAGLSGASAVILGAIGSHSLFSQEKNDRKVIFDTANRFHFFYSLALMGVPMTKYPVMTGLFMFSGMLLFSGTLYHRAFTGEKTLSRYAPIGGSCLIVAFLTFLL